MDREYDAIIVGGGLAGLTSAAYLCRYGYRVLLCEKGQKTGGLVNTFWYQNFAFDAGIRAFENSGILFPMLKSLSINIEFCKNPVSIGIADNWVRHYSHDSLENYVSTLTVLFPDNANDIAKIAVEIKKVMNYMSVLYGIDNPLFLENMHEREYLFKTLLPWLLKYQVNIGKASRLNKPVYVYLQQFTKNQALIDIIAQHFFKNTPTFFALSYFGLYPDYCYPKGGTGVLSQNLTEYICSAGGVILTSAAVTHIDALKKEIRISDGGIYKYQKLIWAADQKTLYASMNAINKPKIRKQSLLVEQSSGGDSVLTLYIGANLDNNYFETRCGPHAFYTPSLEGLSSLLDWKQAAAQGVDELFKWIGINLERTTYEISCPALRDASLAPEGQTGIIISTLMDYRLVRHLSDNAAYEVFKEFCRNKIIKVLDATLFPGIHKHTLFSFCATPLTIERETGNAQGAITGWAFTNSSIPAENRLKKISKSINTPQEDILQCGQWTFSPSGLPVSILTGKLAADAVHQKLKGII